MDVTPLIRRDLNIIQSYKNGQYVIAGQSYTGALSVTADEVFVMPPCAVDELNPSMLAHLIGKVEIVLCGSSTGGVMPPSASRRAEFRAAGFSIDLMDIGSACRTYNVLVAEGRKVAVILL